MWPSVAAQVVAKQAHDAAHQHGFAGPGGSDHAEDLARFDVQVDAVEHRPPLAPRRHDDQPGNRQHLVRRDGAGLGGARMLAGWHIRGGGGGAGE